MQRPIVIALTVSAAAAAFAPGAGAAGQQSPEAQQRSEQVQAKFQELDRDGNGYIDAQEAQAERGLRSAFPRIAPDGQLEASEFAAWYEEYDKAPAEE